MRTELEELKRRLARQQRVLKSIEDRLDDDETKLTYHAGFSVGYIMGKISEIENRIDQINT